MHDGTWDTLSQILGALPAEALLFGNDKTPLGKLAADFEQLLSSNPDPQLAVLLKALGSRIDGLLIDEGGDEVKAAVKKTLRELARPDAPQRLMAILVGLSGQGGQEVRAPAPAVGKVSGDIPVDQIHLNGPEDVAIYREFILESGEHLDHIEEAALSIESSGLKTELVNDMFRCFHSMKGAAGFMGLVAINGLCHEAETLLDRLRKLTLSVTPEVVEILLKAIDTSKHLLTALQKRLDATESGKPGGEAPAPIDTRELIAQIRDLLGTASSQPQPVEAGRIGGVLVAEGAVTEQQLMQALAQQQKPVGQILVDMGATTPDKVQDALSKTESRLGGGSVKVDTAKLDHLLEMVGELVIAQTLVAQDPVLKQDGNRHLTKNVVQLNAITTRMQELAMSLRLVPLKQTFSRMTRLVRDTAHKTGKEVRFEIHGEETEIDKTVCDEIVDPLIHILRNAVDHGCELPKEREARGKPREATVRLSAYHQGGNVMIEVSDDGAGLNYARILQKARERGLVGPDDTPPEERLAGFIFAAGFSTAEEVTDLSGRGVGMDVVRRNIERLGGRVEVQSHAGEGSLFLIRLPLTMAIVDGMVVCVGDERYILPTLGIEESLRPLRSQVSSVTGRGELLLIRGQLVPLMRLGELFGIETRFYHAWEGLAIILNAHGRKCAVVVDDLLGQQQVVIKNLGAALGGIGGIAGGCILGDGRVGLILDVPGLVGLALEGQAAAK